MISNNKLRSDIIAQKRTNLKHYLSQNRDITIRYNGYEGSLNKVLEDQVVFTDYGLTIKAPIADIKICNQ
jgi:hypothetical protein